MLIDGKLHTRQGEIREYIASYVGFIEVLDVQGGRTDITNAEKENSEKLTSVYYFP